MSDSPDWEYLYRQGEKTIDKRDARIATLEAKSRTRLDAQLTERYGREWAEAEVKRLRHFNHLAIDLDVTKTARIVELEAARAETFGQFQHMAKVALEQQRRAEKAEAELE